MIKLYRQVVRERRRLLFWLSGTTSSLAVMAWSAQNDGISDKSRFGCLAAFAAISVAGAFAITATWRRWREARSKLGVDDAPKPMQVAMQYLLDERRTAWRGVQTAALTGVAATFGWVIVQWPQAAALARMRPVCTAVATIGFAATILLPLRHRGSFVNVRFLRAYLRQQSRFAGFRPLSIRAARRRMRNLTGPAVRRARKGVRAGGFDWTWGDFTKGMLVLGQPGSGKTNAVVSTILHLLFEMLHRQGFSAFVQDIKGDYGAALKRLCETYGLSARLCVFDLMADPATRGTRDAIVFNPLDTDEPALEVVSSLIEAFKMLGLKSAESFFLDSAKLMAVSFLTLLRAGLPDDEPPSIEHFPRLALELSRPAETVTEDGEVVGHWPFFDSLCARIRERHTGVSLPTPIAEALEYVFEEYAQMPDRQRAGVIGTLRQLTLDLMAEPARHFLTGRTTISMDQIVEENRILYVHAPEAFNPRQSMLVNLILKAAYQRTIRRKKLRGASPSFMMADEFHNLWAPGPTGDSQFFSLSRENNHANIIACQNLPLLYQRTANKAEVTSMLGNLAVKIFLRNTEPDTNAFASKLFGEMTSIVVAPSEAASLGGILRRNTTHYARSTAKVPVVSAETFTALAVPASEEPFTETIVHLATRKETERLRLFWKVHPL